MLVRNLGLASLTLLALSAEVASAGDCDIQYDSSGRAAYTPENKEKRALDANISREFKANGEKPALYFVFPSGEIAPLLVNPESDRVEIPAVLAKKLSAVESVKVYNYIGSSAYFVPYSREGLRGMKTRTDFIDASEEKRRADGKGCTTVNLKGRETVTILYGNVSKWADKVTYLDRMQDGNKKLSKDESDLLKESILILNKKLGVVAGANRSPASGSATPIYESTEKKLPSAPIGSSQSKTPQKSTTGN